MCRYVPQRCKINKFNKQTIGNDCKHDTAGTTKTNGNWKQVSLAGNASQIQVTRTVFCLHAGSFIASAESCMLLGVKSSMGEKLKLADATASLSKGGFQVLMLF